MKNRPLLLAQKRAAKIEQLTQKWIMRPNNEIIHFLGRLGKSLLWRLVFIMGKKQSEKEAGTADMLCRYI